MAFGFDREPGRARGYVNRTNPDFAIGQRLSRRKYEAYIERIGKRTRLPGAAAIREAEIRLEAIRADLAGERDDRLAWLAAEEKRLAAVRNRRERTDAGQRRFNTVLEAYVSEQRRQGRKVTKTEARKSAEFKSIMADIKGKKNPRNDPNIRDENRYRRLKALDRLGGSNVFREYYERLYGAPGSLGGRGGSPFGGVSPSGRSVIVRRRVA